MLGCLLTSRQSVYIMQPMSPARPKPQRIPTHIRAADKPDLERLRKLISDDVGISNVSDPDVLSKAIHIAIDHYKKRARMKK